MSEARKIEKKHATRNLLLVAQKNLELSVSMAHSVGCAESLESVAHQTPSFLIDNKSAKRFTEDSFMQSPVVIFTEHGSAFFESSVGTTMNADDSITDAVPAFAVQFFFHASMDSLICKHLEMVSGENTLSFVFSSGKHIVGFCELEPLNKRAP